jgi:pSer/pThr/pTyr-binding forkhead associated (FHA) protein
MGLALKFISGKYLGGEVVLPEEGELLIGRATELDLVLAEDMVSRKHAKLTAHGGTVSISDLGSTNGTFVNGEKVRRADLKLRDRILIGTSILKVIDTSELTTATGERRDVKAMLERLAERAPDSSTMSGDLNEVPLPDLLQLFATNQKSGVLTLSGSQHGKVYLKGGRLLYAVITGEAPLSPMKALCRMLGWPGGHFVFDRFEDNVEFAETFTGSTEGVLIEALRQIDELRRLERELPAVEAQLHLCLPMTPKLSALSAAELDLLQLALNFGTVKTTVDRAAGTDFEAYTTLLKLLQQGYLETE